MGQCAGGTCARMLLSLVSDDGLLLVIFRGTRRSGVILGSRSDVRFKMSSEGTYKYARLFSVYRGILCIFIIVRLEQESLGLLE